MTIQERIAALGKQGEIQARRYGRLPDRVRAIALPGIARHFDACDRAGVDPDVAAVREIIDDAWDGRAVYEEKEWVPKRGVSHR